jgi:hypothetical protein
MFGKQTYIYIYIYIWGGGHFLVLEFFSRDPQASFSIQPVFRSKFTLTRPTLLKQGIMKKTKMLKSIKFWGTDSLKPITCAIYINIIFSFLFLLTISGYKHYLT